VAKAELAGCPVYRYSSINSDVSGAPNSLFIFFINLTTRRHLTELVQHYRGALNFSILEQPVKH